MKFVNCLPYKVVIMVSIGQQCVFEPSGINTWVDFDTIENVIIDGILIKNSIHGDIFNLPPSEPDTLFIVSNVVAHAAKDRFDLITPRNATTISKEDDFYIVAPGFIRYI